MLLGVVVCALTWNAIAPITASRKTTVRMMESKEVSSSSSSTAGFSEVIPRTTVGEPSGAVGFKGMVAMGICAVGRPPPAIGAVGAADAGRRGSVGAPAAGAAGAAGGTGAVGRRGMVGATPAGGAGGTGAVGRKGMVGGAALMGGAGGTGAAGATGGVGGVGIEGAGTPEGGGVGAAGGVVWFVSSLMVVKYCHTCPDKGSRHY